MKKKKFSLNEIQNFFRTPKAQGGIVFLVISVVSVIVFIQTNKLSIAEEYREAFYVADATRDQIEVVLTHGLSATQSLAMFVTDGTIPHNIDLVSKKILTTYKHIDALELMPNGVIEYVYPYATNKEALGYDVLNDPVKYTEAITSIRERSLVFAGP